MLPEATGSLSNSSKISCSGCLNAASSFRLHTARRSIILAALIDKPSTSPLILEGKQPGHGWEPSPLRCGMASQRVTGWTHVHKTHLVCLKAWRGAPVCSDASTSHKSVGNMSGRVAAHWPHLMNAGPAA